MMVSASGGVGARGEPEQAATEAVTNASMTKKACIQRRDKRSAICLSERLARAEVSFELDAPAAGLRSRAQVRRSPWRTDIPSSPRVIETPPIS